MWNRSQFSFTGGGWGGVVYNHVIWGAKAKRSVCTSHCSSRSEPACYVSLLWQRNGWECQGGESHRNLKRQGINQTETPDESERKEMNLKPNNKWFSPGAGVLSPQILRFWFYFIIHHTEKMSLGKGSRIGPWGPEGALERDAHWLFWCKNYGTWDFQGKKKCIFGARIPWIWGKML